MDAGGPGPAYRPFWWEDWAPSALPQTDIAPECDAVIVGAGYTGLSAALTLARAGRSVQVFDADVPGAAASSRNGGIGSGTIKSGLPTLMKQWGRDKALAAYGEAAAARADLKRFIEDEAIDCDFKLSGRYTGAMRAAQYDELSRTTEILNKHLDINAAMVPKADQHTEIGTELYHGGMVRTDIGCFHPALFYRGLLERTREAGAVIHGETAVLATQRQGTGFEIKTARGTVKAGDVIVCTNGYTDGSQPWLRRRLVPVGSQMIATEPLGDNMMKKLMPAGRVLSETRKMSHYYRPSPDGQRILFGGRLYGTHKADTPLPYDQLRRDLTEIFPELDEIGISHVWWGFVAFPMDMMPLSAKHEGIHYAAGYNGSGVVWARWFGMKAAYRVLGDDRGQSAFTDRVCRAVPLYTGKPWFLPAVQAWYGLKDRYGF